MKKKKTKNPLSATYNWRNDFDRGWLYRWIIFFNTHDISFRASRTAEAAVKTYKANKARAKKKKKNTIIYGRSLGED